MVFDQDTVNPGSSVQADWLSTFAKACPPPPELSGVIEIIIIIIIIIIIDYHYVHAGLMLVLLYGREGWFAPLIRATGFNIVFAFPGQHQVPLQFRQGIQLHKAFYCAKHCIANTTLCTKPTYVCS